MLILLILHWSGMKLICGRSSEHVVVVVYPHCGKQQIFLPRSKRVNWLRLTTLRKTEDMCESLVLPYSAFVKKLPLKERSSFGMTQYLFIFLFTYFKKLTQILPLANCHTYQISFKIVLNFRHFHVFTLAQPKKVLSRSVSVTESVTFFSQLHFFFIIPI